MSSNIFIEKVFPIKGREDFFKYVVMVNKEIATDLMNQPMYFDKIEEAEAVQDACQKVYDRLVIKNQPKIFVSVRTVIATSQEEAILKIEEGQFAEDTILSDRVVTIEELKQIIN